ncbi:MAG: hypothetical protein JWQ04_1081 [Pedosphaera sp.]|nr:hypothetical protein [Pedosphaera sp.]
MVEVKFLGGGQAILQTMNNTDIVYWLTWLNAGCWGVCFWWMHRISSRQDALLNQLKTQARRIETLSKEEHALIKEVHPQVGELVEGMQEVVDSVRENEENKPAGGGGNNHRHSPDPATPVRKKTNQKP